MNDPNAPLMLSVSGLRGLVGASLTPTVAAQYGCAIARYFLSQRKSPNRPAHVVIGRDSRPSGSMVEGAVVSALLASGCRVTRLGIVSTPGVAVMVDGLHADGGVVITASHNPIIWNGIKTLNHEGSAPPGDQARAIIDDFHHNRADLVGVEKYSTLEDHTRANEIHARRVLDRLDTGAIRRAKLRVVVDSVCGAGGLGAAALLNELGVELIHIHKEPTGIFPHTPEPTRENLVGLCDAVKQHKAHVGFAQDPDADRLAIVDERGEYIGEEYTLVLAALRLMERKPGPMAANLSTSRMLDDVAGLFNSKVRRTPVGEAHVAAAMRKTGSTIGGEGNGGVIWPEVVYVRDSLSGMGLVLELMATSGKSLSQLVSRVPAYAIVKDKLPIKPGMADRVCEAIKKKYAGQSLDTQDGLRIDWPDRWVHVRPSNTEPIMRIIAEAPTEAVAKALVAEVRAVV